MKVYCSGSQMVCSYDNMITWKLDEYILSQVDLMISDYDWGDHELQQYLAASAYKNVTVVFTRDLSEFEECPRENLGKWPYREFIRRCYEYSVDLTLVSAMAEECDEGFFAWREPDWDVFMGILCFLANDKTCNVYSSKTRTLRTLNSLEELLEYVGDESGVEQKESDLMLGNKLDVNELLQYTDFPDNLRKKILSKGKQIHKQDLKKIICKSNLPISKKREIVEKFVDAENQYVELIGVVRTWKASSRDKSELYRLLMETKEHSFLDANISLYIAESWIKNADGRQDSIVLYLFERFILEDGKVTDIPVGIYTDISEALYYLQSSMFDSAGGRIDVWEKSKRKTEDIHYKHRLTLYSDHSDIIGFEFMRVSDLVNDCDPFEPVTYQSRNTHYVNSVEA